MAAAWHSSEITVPTAARLIPIKIREVALRHWRASRHDPANATAYGRAEQPMHLTELQHVGNSGPAKRRKDSLIDVEGCHLK